MDISVKFSIHEDLIIKNEGSLLVLPWATSSNGSSLLRVTSPSLLIVTSYLNHWHIAFLKYLLRESKLKIVNGWRGNTSICVAFESFQRPVSVLNV